MTTASSAFLRRLEHWADSQLRAAGVPADIGSQYGAVADAIVRRAVRETPIRGDVAVAVQRLVREEIAAHTRGG